MYHRGTCRVPDLIHTLYLGRVHTASGGSSYSEENLTTPARLMLTSPSRPHSRPLSGNQAYYVFKRKRTDPPSLYCYAHQCSRNGCVNNKSSGDRFCGGIDCLELDPPEVPEDPPTICTHTSKTLSKSGLPRK